MSKMNDLYYPADFIVTDIGSGSALIRNRNNGRITEMSVAEYRLFAELQGALSIDEHLWRLLPRNIYGLSDDRLKMLIGRWKKLDLLRHSTLLGVKKGRQNSNKERICAAVFTSDRSEMLSKWLRVRCNHRHYFDRSIPLIIMDDSISEQHLKKNRALIEYYRKVYPGEVHYFGNNEKEEYCAGLIRKSSKIGIESDIIRFALFGPADTKQVNKVGANRNFALLAWTGENILFSDDDIHYSLFKQPFNTSSKCRLAPAESLSVDFYPSLDELYSSICKEQEYNLIENIESNLGLSLSRIVADSADLAMLPSAMARRIEIDAAQIGVVCAGHCGARWFNNPDFIIGNRESYNARIYDDEGKYRESLKHGYNFSAFDQATISDGNFLQSGTMALSGMLTPPPFFPIDRNEDPTFGILLRQIYPDQYVMHLPVASEHDISAKSTMPELNPDMEIPSIGRFTQLIAADLTNGIIALKAEERLNEIGLKYEKIGKLSDKQFDEYLTSLYCRYAQIRMGSLESQLYLYQYQPVWWVEDVRKVISAYEYSIRNPLRDIPAGFKSWMEMYGRVLRAWYEIMRCAVSVNDETIRRGFL